MKKLIFFDIDGTLYDNKNDQIPRSTVKALEELKKNPDVEIAIATGRANYILGKLDEILPYFDAFVYLNGLHITYKGEELHCHIPNEDQVLDLVNTLKQNDFIHGAFSKTGEYISKITPKIEADFDAVKLEVPTISDLSDVSDLMQVYFFGSNDDFKMVQDAHPDFSVVPWHNNGADILPKGVSKDVGIKLLAEKLGYELKDVMAFGDAANDLQMIKAAGTGVVMGNGISELKEIADYITDTVDEDGIYNALKHFKLI